jgi:hypothetical protein
MSILKLNQQSIIRYYKKSIKKPAEVRSWRLTVTEARSWRLMVSPVGAAARQRTSRRAAARQRPADKQQQPVAEPRRHSPQATARRGGTGKPAGEQEARSSSSSWWRRALCSTAGEQWARPGHWLLAETQSRSGQPPADCGRGAQQLVPGGGVDASLVALYGLYIIGPN